METELGAGDYTHVYSNLGQDLITVGVRDANGVHSNIASYNVTVGNSSIALTGNPNANPGGTYTLNLGAVTDPGYTVSSYVVNWGDGASNTFSNLGDVTHVFSNSTSSSVNDNISVDLVDNSGHWGTPVKNERGCRIDADHN